MFDEVAAAMVQASAVGLWIARYWYVLALGGLFLLAAKAWWSCRL